MDLNLGYTQKIIKEAKARGVLRNALAYILATAYWETGRTMKPVKEAYWLSEDWRKENLRYYPWYGRGFVQLTWEDNYRKAGDKLGVNLIKNKDLALDPDIAAKILVQGMIEGWFTGDSKGRHTLDRYFTLKSSDWEGARRIINGVDKKAEIAKIAKEYNQDLIKIGYGVEDSKAEISPPEEDKGAEKTGESRSIASIIILAIINLLKKLL